MCFVHARTAAVLLDVDNEHSAFQRQRPTVLSVGGCEELPCVAVIGKSHCTHQVYRLGISYELGHYFGLSIELYVWHDCLIGMLVLKD